MRSLMRPGATCALLLAAACSSALWSSEEGHVTTTVGLPPDSVMRVAMTQLEHHGFRVYSMGGGVLITEPRAVPEHVRQGGEGERWIIRVGVEPLSFVRGSRVRVTGYTVPEGAGVRPVSDNQVRETTTAVTNVRNPRLFREVQAVARWISDAVARRSD